MEARLSGALTESKERKKLADGGVGGVAVRPSVRNGAIRPS